MLTMPASLTAADARVLAALAAPAWQRRAAAPLLFVLGAIQLGAVVAAVEVVCSEAAPCQTHPLDPILSGLFVGLLPLGWISLRLTAVMAVIFAVTGIVFDGSDAAVPAPAWGWALTWTYVLICIGLALWLDRRPRVPAWLESTAHRATPPSPARFPQLSLVAIISGIALLVLVGILAMVNIDQQRRGDARQRTAELVHAQVVRHERVDVVVLRPDGRQSKIHVYDVNAYPVGSTMALRVDDDGLAQPVAEPYDAGGWLMLAAIAAPSGIGLIVRAGRRRRELTRLFAEPSPVTGVFIHAAGSEVVIYPTDAVPGSPPIYAMRIVPDVASAVSAAIAAGRYDSRWHHYPAEPAELYGLPVPGQWCALVVSGRVITPVGPLTETRSTTRFIPPYPWQA